MSKLKDGFSASIGFANLNSGQILVHETDVTPPGVDGGDAIEVTTMRNTAYRTFAPRSLKTMTPCKVVGGYEVDAYSDVIAQVNLNQLVTITFSDDSTIEFYGFLKSFTPNGMTEGAMPLADIEIVPTNLNGADVETAPVIE